MAQEPKSLLEEELKLIITELAIAIIEFVIKAVPLVVVDVNLVFLTLLALYCRVLHIVADVVLQLILKVNSDLIIEVMLLCFPYFIINYWLIPIINLYKIIKCLFDYIPYDLSSHVFNDIFP